MLISSSADENPDGAAIRSLMDTIKQYLSEVPSTAEEIWLACTYSLRFTGMSTRELNELKRQHNDLSVIKLFGYLKTSIEDANRFQN